jgi:hypothetical protein
MTYYEENGEGGFTSDLSTSVFDFFLFVSFLASCFNFLVGFFADPLSFFEGAPEKPSNKKRPRIRSRKLYRVVGTQVTRDALFRFRSGQATAPYSLGLVQ